MYDDQRKLEIIVHVLVLSIGPLQAEKYTLNSKLLSDSSLDSLASEPLTDAPIRTNANGFSIKLGVHRLVWGVQLHY